MSENKPLTPMKKVSSEMKQLREKFQALGFENVGLNRCDTVTTKYSDWYCAETSSTRHAVKNDRTELFIKEVSPINDSTTDTFQFGVSFNYTGEEKENVITVSLTENSFTHKNPKNKILKESMYVESMDVKSFRTFVNELLLVMDDENYLINIKNFISQCNLSSSFKEKDRKLNRMVNK